MDRVTIWKEFEYLIYNPEERQPQELFMLNRYMRRIFFFFCIMLFKPCGLALTEVTITFTNRVLSI